MAHTTSHTKHTIAYEGNNLDLVERVRQGIKYRDFMLIANATQFTLPEWSRFLHLSARTMQRYQKEKKAFPAPQSEKILEIEQLNNKGIEVFKDKDNFNSWLETKNIALGGVKPKELLDTSFGVSMVKDELTRIEYGVLA